MDESKIVVIPDINVEVTIKKYKDPVTEFGYKWLIEPQIWHPSVFFIGSYAIEPNLDTLVELLNDPYKALGNPANIDAAIQYQRDKKGYLEKNRQIQEAIAGHKECPVCFSEFKDPKNIRFMCYNKHWICKQCFYTNKIENCVLCRFKFRTSSKKFSDVKKCINCVKNDATIMRENNQQQQFCSHQCAKEWYKLIDSKDPKHK